jgi:hypothetical protein
MRRGQFAAPYTMLLRSLGAVPNNQMRREASCWRRTHFPAVAAESHQSAIPTQGDAN